MKAAWCCKIDKFMERVPAGRATVELTIEKQDGSLAYVTNEGGGPQKEVRWQAAQGYCMNFCCPRVQCVCICQLLQHVHQVVLQF